MTRIGFRTAIGALILAALLSACTITVRPSGVGTSDYPLSYVIEEFRPTRGSGASYGVGENIDFMIVVSQPGYVTLSAIDPDGSVYVFARNLRVESGVNYLPRAADRVVYTAGAPRGLHYVRASFTSGRTDASVTYRGRSGGSEWNSAINLEIRGFPVRDVAETTLYIR